MSRTFIVGGLLVLAALLLIGLLDPHLYPFPVCPFKSWTGFLCPGCGSQRAMHFVLHGQFGKAFLVNPIFIPGLIYALIGYMLSVFSADWPRIRKRFYAQQAAYVALCIIILYWIGRNIL